jgi:hypothetical protein
MVFETVSAKREEKNPSDILRREGASGLTGERRLYNPLFTLYM